jgi:hypothetical protein
VREVDRPEGEIRRPNDEIRRKSENRMPKSERKPRVYATKDERNPKETHISNSKLERRKCEIGSPWKREGRNSNNTESDLQRDGVAARAKEIE